MSLIIKKIKVNNIFRKIFLLKIHDLISQRPYKMNIFNLKIHKIIKKFNRIKKKANNNLSLQRKKELWHAY